MRIIPLLLLVLALPMASALEVSISSQDPAPAEAGQGLNVWFLIENDANEQVDEAYIIVTPQDGLRLSPGEEARKRIPPISARGTNTVQYRLLVDDSAPEGPNVVEAELDQGGATSSTDLLIEVAEKDLKEVSLEVGRVTSDPTRVKPDDDDVSLEVLIQNLGDAAATATTARLRNLPEGITFSQSYSDTALLGNIDEDDAETALFYVDVADTVVPGEYQANMQVSYKYKPYEDEEDYELETVVLPVRITVKEIPLYEITNVELSPESLRQGERNVQLKVTIKNVGLDEGENVRVKIYTKSEQPFVFDVSSNFVAPRLAPGEEGQATLEFRVEDDAALQDYIMDVEIKNLVDDDVLTYEKELTIAVSQERQQSPLGLIIGIAVVLVIIGIIVARRRRKRSRKGARKVKPKYEKSYLDKK